MKKLLYTLLLPVIMLTACNEPENDKGKLDPNAMILLRGVETNTRAQVAGLTPLEVVEQAVAMRWKSHWFDNDFYEKPYIIARGFDERQRDFDIPALKMWGTDIIMININYPDGVLYRDFLYGFDIYFTNIKNDTIGYIPQHILETARPLIEKAWEERNYTEVYRLFDEAFVFHSISN